VPADAAVEKALEGAERAVLAAVRQGDYEAAAKLLMATMREAFSLTLRGLGELREVVSEQGKQIGQLADGLEALREQVSELAAGLDGLRAEVSELTRDVARLVRVAMKHEGDIGRLEGIMTELRTRPFLRDWFERRAPEYDVVFWDGMGADVVIEGRGVLAAVDVVVKPKPGDVDQFKKGMGAIKTRWGRKPDLLVIYSQLGVVPENVARYAAERGVRIVRGPRELRELLDRLAEEREGRAGRASEG